MNDFSIQTEDMTLILREGADDFRLMLTKGKESMAISLSLNEVLILHNNLKEMLETYVTENIHD